MPRNIGTLTANRGASGDECYTPFYAVAPLLKHLDKDLIYWLPFDEDWSAFAQLMTEEGFKIVISNIRDGQDFFTYEPDEWDAVISNPPFSKKDRILARLTSLNKPFAILLPINTLQGQRRFNNLKDIQLLSFDKRIGYHTNFNFETTSESNHFASAYFTKGILHRDLVMEVLTKFQRPLITEAIE